MGHQDRVAHDMVTFMQDIALFWRELWLLVYQHPASFPSLSLALVLIFRWRVRSTEKRVASRQQQNMSLLLQGSSYRLIAYIPSF